jgi:hypothetical protein
MSDTSPAAAGAAAIPPGWYDDGSGRMRWWSGVEWTQHVAAPHPAAVAVRPPLPADRPVYSVWIWLIVLIPLLTYGAFFFWQPNFDYLGGAISSPGSLASMYSSMFASILSPAYFVIVALGLITYGLSALFAWRDAVWLRAQGVVRPFSWPWVFLYSAVYVIGRSVIVYRVARPRGRAPIWVLIAVIVLGFAVSLIWTFIITASMMSSILSNLPDYSGQYS